MRSVQLTSAHNMPTAPSSHNKTGKPPAGVSTSRRTIAASKVGTKVSSHTTRRIEVADVDHGSDTATPTAAQSAIWASRLRSSTLAANRRFVFISLSYFEIGESKYFKTRVPGRDRNRSPDS